MPEVDEQGRQIYRPDGSPAEYTDFTVHPDFPTLSARVPLVYTLTMQVRACLIWHWLAWAPQCFFTRLYIHHAQAILPAI